MLIDEIKIFSKEIKSKIDFNYDLKKSNWFTLVEKQKFILSQNLFQI